MEMWPAVAVTMFLLLADNVKIEPLNYKQLSRATSFPRHVVENCVQECHATLRGQTGSFRDPW